jgi:LuxR family transcriptional regulator, maltose regulon positive regulatory protein
MRIPLVSTKLTIPLAKRELVSRPRLVDRLNQGLEGKLILVSAPAGYGKTQLLSTWARKCSLPVGWISLDEGDNDQVRFLSYLLASLENIQPGIGENIIALLQLPQIPIEEELLANILNDIARSEKPFILVLDDYHLIHEPVVHRILIYLLNHFPPQIHLVIASRADPPLQLARLRARSELTELRLADLSFTVEESTQFCNRIMELGLQDEQVTALTTRTEGWIAGLQMAALSLHASTDKSGWIKSLSGSHRFILDYLVEEVLKDQPEGIQTFLINTSLLDRLAGSLCDTIMGREDSQEILEKLERANLFILPLDEERLWYRYHRLFSDLLQKRLSQISPDLGPVLHCRASNWFEKHGFVDEAIHHALAAKSYERAAILIEDNVEATLMRSEVKTFLNWIDRLPDEYMRARPKLGFFRAWALLMSGHPLEVVERHLHNIASDMDAAEMTSIMDSRISVLQAYLMTFKADIQHAAALCRQALEQLPKNDLFLRSIAAWILSLERLQNGDLQDGILALNEVARLSQDVGNTLVTVGVLCDQAKLYKRQGRLQQAKVVLERALQLATGPQGQRLPVASKALIEMGDIKREWNYLEEAEADLAESIELSRQWSEIAAFSAYLPLARIRMAQGDMVAARQVIETACQIAQKSEATQLDDLVADLLQAIFFIRQGDIAAAMHWAQKRGVVLGVSPEPCPGLDESQDYISSHLRKYQQIVLARLFILQVQAAEALDLLEALLAQSQELGRIDLTIEIQILRALAFQIQGDTTQAMDALAQALSLAEPGGYIRIFLDEGEAMIHLLRQAASQGLAPSYVAKLLATSGEPDTTERDIKPSHSYLLIEPLSERELQVLCLLAAGMSNREIADELVVAVSTIHSHCKSIYGKLDVHARSDAVQRAWELELI